jgi:hypothetical protein
MNRLLTTLVQLSLWGSIIYMIRMATRKPKRKPVYNWYDECDECGAHISEAHYLGCVHEGM